MTLSRFAFVLMLSITPATATAAAAVDTSLIAAKRSLQEAVTAGRPEALLKARAQFQARSAADPASAALHYWVAVASWRVAPILMQTDRKKAELITKDGLAHCDEALRLNENLAEGYAVKGGLMGMMTLFDPASMMTLGPQSEANIYRALGMAPKNPRVRLFQGIGTLNKPAQFGGGPDKALEMFKQAQALFAADSAGDPAAADWGREDASLWAGQAAMRLGDFVAARDFFVSALKLSPDNAWVRYRLLPAAQDSLAKRARSIPAADSLSRKKDQP